MLPRRSAERPGGRSERLYQKLLAVYPADYRREYAPQMAQLFRDLLRDARRQHPALGPARLWLRVLPELGLTAGREHLAELRRAAMANKRNEMALAPGAVPGILWASLLIAAGLLGKVAIFELGGPPSLALGVQIGSSVAAALIMEAVTKSSGVVVLSMGLLCAAVLLPLLWVPDAAAWLRENPINTSILVILAAWIGKGRFRWSLLAGASVLAAAQVIVSFI
jgi:hypothetical protein